MVTVVLNSSNWLCKSCNSCSCSFMLNCLFLQSGRMMMMVVGHARRFLKVPAGKMQHPSEEG